MIDEVTRVLVNAAELAIKPRFRSLVEGDVTEKAPGDPVTVADREAEQLISKGLREILNIPVVGEEAVADNPSLLAALDGDACWLVDPVDGTSNFVAGHRDYAVMAALVGKGEPVAGWIFLPESDRRYVTQRGSGAFRNGVRLRRPSPPAEIERLRGAAPTKRLDDGGRAHLRAISRRVSSLGTGTLSAGVNYTRLVDGDFDFVLYQRSMPWDHAAGTLLLAETGGTSVRPDGTLYRVTTNPNDQLLNAADPMSCEAVRSAIWDI
ncbi:inositol monophosphatase family protein [Nocardia nova]|uniref:inositol monophosphatase family protein n=1 Tax=Nocardia nova TaxID=37330 RepID=UPI0037B464E3